MSLPLAKKIAKITVKNVPSKFECSELLFEFIQKIPEILGVTLPNEEDARFLYIGAGVPTDGARGSFFIKLDGSGIPLSIRYFIDGGWKDIFNFRQVPQWRNGNYQNDKEQLEKDGFVLADGTNGGADISHLFRKISSTPVNYDVYAVYFMGSQIVRR